MLWEDPKSIAISVLLGLTLGRKKTQPGGRRSDRLLRSPNLERPNLLVITATSNLSKNSNS